MQAPASTDATATTHKWRRREKAKEIEKKRDQDANEPNTNLENELNEKRTNFE